jgi:hypothetical protein
MEPSLARVGAVDITLGIANDNFLLRHMNPLKGAAIAVLISSLATNAFLYVQWSGGERTLRQWSASIDQVEVVRTKGGLLQVSTVRSPEHFSATKPHNILGFDLGATTTNIRVPATYHYHIDLAPEWKVRVRPDRSIVVVAPPVKPTLPVAINTSQLERQAQGRWSLITGTAELDGLQKTITETLGRKASSPSYINYQREAARQTVLEFVQKWLITQEKWKDVRGSAIKVYFADEAISSLPESALPEFKAAP